MIMKRLTGNAISCRKIAGVRAHARRCTSARPNRYAPTAASPIIAASQIASPGFSGTSVTSLYASNAVRTASAAASTHSTSTAARRVTGPSSWSLTVPSVPAGKVLVMRALLVVNPNATTTNARSRDVLARALRSEMDLEVANTRRRGHAAELARQASANGIDVLVALGGDGTVNEVVNGLLADGPGPHVPALAVVPGGSTNVFARAVGLPRDPIEATGVLLEALREKRTRSIGLGL